MYILSIPLGQRRGMRIYPVIRYIMSGSLLWYTEDMYTVPSFILRKAVQWDWNF